MTRINTLIALLSLTLASINIVWAGDDHRAVTVTGQASVTAAPDIAYVSMSVVERSLSLDTARQAAAKVTANVLALTDKLKIDRKQVDTTGMSVRPDYRWNRQKEEQELLGYLVERNVRIELRDLEKLGQLIEGAVGTGVNQVSPPVLDSTKRQSVERQALAMAATDARANATALANALNVKLGSVISVDATSGAPVPQPMYRMQADMAMAEGAPETYNSGDLRFTANVRAVFELEGNDD